MPARRIISSAGVLCSGGRGSRPLRRRRNPLLPKGRGRAGRLTAFGVRGSGLLPMRALQSSRCFRTGRSTSPTQPHSASDQHCRAVQSPHWFGCMFLWWTPPRPRRHTHRASLRRGRLASGSPRLSETPLCSPLKSVTIIKYKYTMILTGQFLRQITQLIYPSKHILSNTFYILSIQKFHIIPNLCYTKKATALIKLIRQGREVDQRVYTKFTA